MKAQMTSERDILHPSEQVRSPGTPAWESHGVLREGAAMKYAGIERNKLLWPVSVQCRGCG